MAHSKLYMIATPLGNLQDVTLRALESFKNLEVFFAEDSREFLKLLSLLGVNAESKKVYSYAAHNMKESTEKALGILAEGKSIGFVTDRGTPGISDPGNLIVEKARESGYVIEPIPGPSSPTTLLSVSGLNDQRFMFLGFLPTTEKARSEIFSLIERANFAACIFESPKRIRDTVSELKSKFPSGKIFFGREMTKMHESFSWHLLSELDPQSLLEMGEYAFLLVPQSSKENSDWSEEILVRLSSDKEWAKSVAKRYGVASSEIYNALQKMKSRPL